MTASWLPPLVLLEDFGGDWAEFVEALYAHYEVDFVKSRPFFRGTTLSVRRKPKVDGKDATFWHIVSEGEIEHERIPDLRRCERIRWPRPIVDNSTSSGIKCWENQRRGETRICLWFEEAEYLVVLAKRKGYVLFLTAYPVTQDHRKQKLETEYQRSTPKS